MGQYYMAVLLADDGANIASRFNPRDYNEFYKLTEHSWLGNPFVEAVERALNTPARVVWAGDYADKEPGRDMNLFRLAQFSAKTPPPDPAPVGRYVINHDKRMFVDKRSVTENASGFALHPLPVLTAEGNGRGSGDLHEANTTGNFTLVGTWARDRIAVGGSVPERYRKLRFDLVELW
ncbi:hypothetical protein [Nocardia amamiensis]|uniref:hypothetical protein n=1 Tax=Nocardia amamiensis TaxID=404578 RepID=UPI00082C1E24|nr:hypothetical protein [Nocardia amamiensis]